MGQNGTKKAGLRPNQKRAVSALLEQPTITAAAEQAKVARSTLSRWLNHDSMFRQALSRAQANSLRELARHQMRLWLKATDRLDSLLDKASLSDGMVLAINRHLSAAVHKSNEMTLVLDRVERIEQQLGLVP